MKLLINPEGGMAGDMFAAALVSAGAEFPAVQAAMMAAGAKLGSATIEMSRTVDGSTQLNIILKSKRHHLGANEARHILNHLFEDFGIREPYREFGMSILDILAKAEKQAHKEFNIVVEGDHHHHDHDHSHEHTHDHDHAHNHGHHHHHHHEEKEETFLHEAQDIVIDIMGAVIGMQQLGIEPEAEMTGPVSVGGGHVHCSHGRLSIPAPATTVIMREHGIEWKKGPIEKELFTPTGAAIMAALKAKINPSARTDEEKIEIRGCARGTRILPIPPLKLFLY